MDSATATTGFLPFSDKSMVRRVHREGVLLLGGGRALLMQIAHPSVARGVVEHSTFRGRRLDRLLCTLRPMLTIAFGTREQALQAAAGVNRMHESISGAGYNATDPDLLLWVHATLIETSLVMHERFLRPLAPDEAEAYYADMRRIGGLLGIPQDVFPPDAQALRDYVAATSDSLPVSDEAKALAAALFESNVATRPALAPARELTAALLPPALRAQFGLSWGRGRDRALWVLERASRSVLPRVPPALRAPPWFLTPANHR